MKFTFAGIVSVTTDNKTLVISQGAQKQLFPIPDGFQVAIAPTLTEAGIIFENGFIVVTEKTALLLTKSEIFSRIEVTPASEKDAKLFFLAAQDDPDVLAFMEKAKAAYNQYSAEILSIVEKVHEQLPEDGETAKLYKYLSGANWKEAFKEVAAAFATTFPKQASLIAGILNEKGKTWMSDLAK